MGNRFKNVAVRPEHVAQILNKNTDEILEWKDLVKLALSPCGGRKSVTNEMEYHIILNKADTKEQKKLARKIAEAIIEQAQMSERERECSENQAHSVVKSVHITDWLYSK